MFDRPGRHFRRHLRVERLAVLGFQVIDDEALYRQRLEEYMRVVLSNHAGLSQYDGHADLFRELTFSGACCWL